MKIGEGYCHICGNRMMGPELKSHPAYVDLRKTRDHLIPKSLGGTDAAVNIAPAHALCNERRGWLKLTRGIREQIRDLVSARYARELDELGPGLLCGYEAQEPNITLSAMSQRPAQLRRIAKEARRAEIREQGRRAGLFNLAIPTSSVEADR